MPGYNPAAALRSRCRKRSAIESKKLGFNDAARTVWRYQVYIGDKEPLLIREHIAPDELVNKVLAAFKTLGVKPYAALASWTLDRDEALVFEAALSVPLSRCVEPHVRLSLIGITADHAMQSDRLSQAA